MQRTQSVGEPLWTQRSLSPTVPAEEPRRTHRMQSDSRLLVALEPTASRGPPPKPSATAEQPEPRGFNRRDDNERAAIRLDMRCVSRKAAVHVTEGRQRPSSSS